MIFCSEIPFDSMAMKIERCTSWWRSKGKGSSRNEAKRTSWRISSERWWFRSESIYRIQIKTENPSSKPVNKYRGLGFERHRCSTQTTLTLVYLRKVYSAQGGPSFSFMWTLRAAGFWTKTKTNRWQPTNYFSTCSSGFSLSLSPPLSLSLSRRTVLLFR